MRFPVAKVRSTGWQARFLATTSLRQTRPRLTRTYRASGSSRLAVSSMVLAALLGFTAPSGGAEPGKAASKKPARTEVSTPTVDVPFDITADRPVIDVRVNGSGPHRFAIETAATGSTLDDDIARTLRMKPADESSGVGATQAAWRIPEVVRVELLEIHGAAFTDFDAAVRDYDTLASYHRRYDGSLGFSVFADCLLTIDYLRHRVKLKQTQLPPANGRDILDYKLKHGVPVIPLSFGETSVDVTIDTGSVEAFVLPESVRDKIKPASNKSTAEPVSTADTEGQSEQTRIEGTVRLGQHLLVEPPVRFHGNRPVMGQVILHHFSVTFDQKNRRVRFTRRARGPIIFETPSKFGLVLETLMQGVNIKDVMPGSPAARIGLTVRDKILRINGWPAADYDAHELRTLLHESTNIVLHVDREGFPLLLSLDAER